MKKPRRIPLPEFPPDIFWITPDGGVLAGIGHLTALRGYPEAFGLAAAPESQDEIEAAFAVLFRTGWVRGRFNFSDGVASFQMDRPRGVPLGNAYDFVLKYKDYVRTVEIDFWDPAQFKAARDFSRDDFLDQKFPATWGMNPKRKGGL